MTNGRANELHEPGRYAITSQLLARNASLNVVAQLIVALAAILLLPIIVRDLGDDAYGLLSLALVVFSSFSLLDLGLGRTTTKFVAEHLAKGDLEGIGPVIWTSFGIQVMLGGLAGLVFGLSTPWLTHHVLKVAPNLISDAELTLLVLAIAIPVGLGSFSLRGALEGAQRFDLVNYIRVSLNLSTYILPFLGARLDLRVPTIVVLMLVARISSTVAYGAGCLHAIPGLRRDRLRLDRSLARRLFAFAGWVAISSLVVPLLTQADRYLVASLTSVAKLTYYTVPYELLNGLLILPAALGAILLPAFSNMSVRDDPKLPQVYTRATKYILVALGPVVILMFFFAGEVLALWQGKEFAVASSGVLQILVAGTLVNALAYVPTSLLLGLGHPDLPAKLGGLELIVYLPIAYLLIRRFGIVGAASAFSGRVVLDAILLFVAAWRLCPSIRRTGDHSLLITMGLLLAFCGGTAIVHSLALGILNQSLILVLELGVYGILAIIAVLDNTDRQILFRTILGLGRYSKRV